MVGDAVRVDLGHHQRHARVHAPGARLVDRDAAALRHLGAELLRERAGGGEEDEVGAVEPVGGGEVDAQRLAAERHGSADRALAGERTELCDGERALGEHVEEDGSDGAGGPDDGDDVSAVGRCRHGRVF